MCSPVVQSSKSSNAPTSTAIDPPAGHAEPEVFVVVDTRVAQEHNETSLTPVG